jgi:hypothetical protein
MDPMEAPTNTALVAIITPTAVFWKEDPMANPAPSVKMEPGTKSIVAKM